MQSICGESVDLPTEKDGIREFIEIVADGYSDKLYELDLSGRVLGVLGGPGRAPGLFSGLHAVAAGPDDSIYVAELLNWRPQRFLRVPKD